MRTHAPRSTTIWYLKQLSLVLDALRGNIHLNVIWCLADPAEDTSYLMCIRSGCSLSIIMRVPKHAIEQPTAIHPSGRDVVPNKSFIFLSPGHLLGILSFEYGRGNTMAAT